MTNGKTGSASLFAVSFIAGTFCYALRSFAPKVPGIAAFLIGFVGVFGAPYIYQFGLLYLRRGYAKNPPGVQADTLHSAHETSANVRKDEANAKQR